MKYNQEVISTAGLLDLFLMPNYTSHTLYSPSDIDNSNLKQSCLNASELSGELQ